METNANSTFPKLVEKNNYEDWSKRVKSELMAQQLWSIVEPTAEPPRREDEAAFTDWSNKNSLALQVIQNSCGEIALNEIKEIKRPNMAWWALAEKYNEPGCYTDLIKALQRGKWDTAEKFFELLPGALSKKITPWGKTALHVVVKAGHEHIVEKLVERMPEEALETRAESDGLTALATAALHGNYDMVVCMLNKREKLVSVRSENGRLPVVTAIVCGHKELGRYLYSRTPREDLISEKGRNGAAVCTAAIYEGILDVALDLLIQVHPGLTLALDFNNHSPLFALASMPDALLGANRLVFWKGWIYSGIHIQLPDGLDEIRVNIRSDQGQTTGSDVGFYFPVQRLLHQLLSNLLSLLGVEHLYGMKLTQTRSKKLLNLMCKELSEANVEEWSAAGVRLAVFRAIKEGIDEVVCETVKHVTEILWMADEHCRSIFSCAVLYRQAKIFSLIYGLPDKKTLTRMTDHFGNNILHMAAMSAPSTQLNRIPGAALQMQSELQWFKEVESIVPHTVREAENKKHSRPRELFTESHKDLAEKGEKWMKDTATSCTVIIGALIVTIMFAAAITLPGGNNQDTGFPMFLKKKSFTVFIESDSLSLLSSSTSVLMFLGILTSSYAEEDFLKSLPRKLIIGLSTLFFSIATMMIAFCTELLVMFESQLWMVIPIICLACVPVTLFVLLQFPILANMVVSTYWSIFNRKMGRWV